MDRFEFECNIDKTIDDGISSIDEWGSAFVWDGKKNSNIGVEYNLCIDRSVKNETENCSAIYYTEYNERLGYLQTDCNLFSHYEIDFTDTEWKNKLKEKMIRVLIDFEKRMEEKLWI